MRIPFSLRSLSLTARIYWAAGATILVVMSYIGYNLYAEQRVAGIMRSILDQRIRMLHVTDLLKSTLLTDQAALFDYLVTGNPQQLDKRQHLIQETVEEIQMLRRLSHDAKAQADLDNLETEVRHYTLDAERLISFFQQTSLPSHPNLFQVVVWAHDRPNQYAGLDMLSGESRKRLERIDQLCDELIAINQTQLDNERHQIYLTLDKERRKAVLAAIFLFVMLALLMSSHNHLIVRPLRALLRGVQRVEQGEFDFQIPIQRLDEIGQLTQSFNQMTRTVNSQRQQLIRESITDGLTGFFNARHFRALLHQEVERAQRLKNNLSVLMIDIDHFKELNDANGHEHGNEILKKAAQKIRDNLREIDSIGRYGGDEFSVILPGASEVEARRLAERIEMAVRPLSFSFSIGGASFSPKFQKAQELIQKADEALYAAKRSGRACVRWADSSSVSPSPALHPS